MLTSSFQAMLNQAKPGRRVTGVVFWDVIASQTGTDILARAASMKAPVIEAAKACPGARVNPLEGTCQTILDMPVEGWRLLLDSQRSLAFGGDVRVEANVPAFATLPEP